MNIDEFKHKIKLLEAHRRRLQERELQLAKLGISADPSIKIEIEEIGKEMRKIKQQVSNAVKKRINEAKTVIEEAQQGALREVEDALKSAEVSIKKFEDSLKLPEDLEVRMKIDDIMLSELVDSALYESRATEFMAALNAETAQFLGTEYSFDAIRHFYTMRSARAEIVDNELHLIVRFKKGMERALSIPRYTRSDKVVSVDHRC